MSRRFLVVGGNAAGMSAASVAKRRDPSLLVTVLEEGPFISYSACGIPYWVSGETEGPGRLITVTLDEARDERRLNVRMGWSALRVDPAKRTVLARAPDGAEERLPYDALCLATGTRPRFPFPVPPTMGGVFAVRHLGEGAAMRSWIEDESPERAVIVGGGYVALEMAEALLARGIATTLVLRRRRVLGESLDAPLAERVLSAVEQSGAQVLVALPLGLDGGERVRAVRTQAGDIPADLVILATGVAPRSELAADAGCALHASGAVLVDRHMRTSVDNIYAAGDCATSWHLLAKRDVHIPLALGANRGGRVVGENVSGGNEEAPAILGTSITRYFDLDIARTGLTEVEAIACGYDALVQAIEDGNRAGYMPGYGRVDIRVVVERGSGRILGAQIVGAPGSGKRIDTFATAIHAGMTAGALEEADLAYAPPYSPTYDPVLIAARLAARKAAR